jgi:hypothetical protein
MNRCGVMATHTCVLGVEGWSLSFLANYSADPKWQSLYRAVKIFLRLNHIFLTVVRQKKCILTQNLESCLKNSPSLINFYLFLRCYP